MHGFHSSQVKLQVVDAEGLQSVRFSLPCVKLVGLYPRALADGNQLPPQVSPIRLECSAVPGLSMLCECSRQTRFLESGSGISGSCRI